MFSLCSHGDGKALTNSQRASCGASERDLTLASRTTTQVELHPHTRPQALTIFSRTHSELT